MKNIILMLVICTSFAYGREYPARVVSVYDGDTLTAEVDLGLGTTRTEKVRLLRIDAPEIRGGTAETKAAAIKSRDWLRERVTGKKITLKTDKDKRGRYGRLLAEIWIDECCVNDELLALGLAEKFKKAK